MTLVFIHFTSFIVLDNARLLQPLCHFILVAPGGVQNRPSAVKKLLSECYIFSLNLVYQFTTLRRYFSVSLW